MVPSFLDFCSDFYINVVYSFACGCECVCVVLLLRHLLPCIVLIAQHILHI